MPDNSGAFDLGSLSAEEQETLEKMAEEKTDENDKERVLTAFAIVVTNDGNPQVVTYEHDDFVVSHPPTPDLVFGAISGVLKDLQAQETANASAHATAQLMMAQARAMAEQQQAAMMQQQLGDLRRG